MACSSLITKYDVFMFDCSGVLWHGKHPIPGAAKLIERLLSQNKKVIFITNNSAKTRQVMKNCISEVLGISVPLEVLYSPGDSLASYIKPRINKGEKVFLIGSQGLAETMDENEIDYIGYGHDMEPHKFAEFAKFAPDPSVKFVIGSFDPHFNYTKLVKAYIYIRECGATYIATNLDLEYPINGHRTIPGTGRLLSGLNLATGSTPLVMGKPSSHVFDLICDEHNISDKSKVLMVGDSLGTDILLGINCGIDTALVLTGITTKEMLSKSSNSSPTYVLDSIADID